MMSAKVQEKILVIKLGALGDFVQALGPMAAIRRHHPQADITLMTTAPYKGFAQGCGYFNHIWLDERPGKLNISGWMKLRKQLARGNFTRVYDLQNSDRTALYFKLFAEVGRPEWVGAAKGASHCNDSPQRTTGHAFDGHVQTLALAGIADIHIDDLSWIKVDIMSLNITAPYVIFVPGSSPSHPEKRWPAKNYSTLAKTLLAQGHKIVLLGSNDDADATGAILKENAACLDLTGRTSLFQIASLARGATAAVGNDTGPMHLIAATGCPCVALYCSASNPVKHGLKGAHVQIIRKENLADLTPGEVIGKLVFR